MEAAERDLGAECLDRPEFPQLRFLSTQGGIVCTYCCLRDNALEVTSGRSSCWFALALGMWRCAPRRATSGPNSPLFHPPTPYLPSAASMIASYLLNLNFAMSGWRSSTRQHAGTATGRESETRRRRPARGFDCDPPISCGVPCRACGLHRRLGSLPPLTVHR